MNLQSSLQHRTYEMESFAYIEGLFVLLGWLGTFLCSNAVEELGRYNVDPSTVTVSGFSSGGAMAMQFHIAFSKDIHGSGTFGGLPYACAHYFKEEECWTCICHTAPTKGLQNIALWQAAEGKIDDTAYLKDDKVYVFFGKNDSGLNPALGPKIRDVYLRFGVDMAAELTIEAEHGYPTDSYGSSCGMESSATQLINNCSYHGAFEMLNHLYGNLTKPGQHKARGQQLGELLEFNQAEFVPGPGSAINASLDSTGFIFVPSQCGQNSSAICKLHLALHGCTQSRAAIGNIFATKTGYLEVAELNNIIVIFPQATPNPDVGNRNGCWDWWNYLQSGNFMNKLGVQMRTLHNIVLRASGSQR